MDKSGVKGEKGVMGFRVLVWTDLCQGYFTMGFDSHGFPECSSPQYGERVPMLHMVGVMGDCQRLLPGMEFPNRK